MRNKKVFKKMLLMVAVVIFVLVCFGKCGFLAESSYS